MQMSVRKKTHELAKALAESPEYLRLKTARETVEERQAAKIMLQDAQDKQARLREKYASGQEIADAELEDLKKTLELVSFNPYIRELMEAEYAFSEMLMEVWRIVGEAIGLEQPDMEDGQETAPPKAEEVRSKLWVPGRDR